MSESWLDRVKVEKNELLARLEKLRAYVTTSHFYVLPIADRMSLTAQLQGMEAYFRALEDRVIRHEGK
jgi:hypothetical protein